MSVYVSLCLSAHVSVLFSVCLSAWLSFNPSLVCLQADHVIRKSQPLLHQENQMETEVLDEVVLQPGSHNRAQKQIHGLDLDSCMVRTPILPILLVMTCPPFSLILFHLL